MECHIRQATIHFVEHGAGVPLVALHGAGVDHREMEAAVEAIVPRDGYRRIYPDLPAMGHSTSGGLTSNNDVVDLLGDFIERVAEGPVLVLGHSYGAYLARGLVARRPDVVLGLALICPLAEHATGVPTPTVVREDDDAYDELEPAHRQGFEEYFVVRTRTTARRYRDRVVPGTALVDDAALDRIFAGWAVDIGEGTFSLPSLILVGRQDSAVGYTDGVGLLDRYPRAGLAVIEGAGHALLHEHPDLVAALVRDWLHRVDQEVRASSRARA